MPAQMQDSKQLVRASYELARRKFAALDGFSPNQKREGIHQLRWHVAWLVATGESNSRMIARMALGNLRQGEQVTRSMARVLGLADLVE